MVWEGRLKGMDMFEHEAQYRAHLGEATDDPLCALLGEVLKVELGARQVDKWWGVGGSQEISCVRFQINHEIITVQAETYIGVDVFGPQSLVDDIMQRVQSKLKLNSVAPLPCGAVANRLQPARLPLRLAVATALLIQWSAA